MEVTKPLTITHTSVGAGGRKSGQASSIFSLSLCSSGRLATSGLDTTIRIWSTTTTTTTATTTTTITDTPATTELLSILSRHTGAVLAVRWSPLEGGILASGADDSIVLIWQRTQQFTHFEAAASGVTGPLKEYYTVIHRLAGHESDVNGVEWSMDGHYLASCGLDGRVFVWDVTNGYALLRRLETEPRKPLKGLIWDPLGQYLAAQSNDGTLFVWRCLDWKLETFISSPYLQDEPAESYTYFSRPSWSPDGRVICLPDTLNETDTVAILVERSDWRCEQSLVGHKSAVQSASFSPCLYKAINNIGTHLLVALGAQDGTISIWSSEGERPLAVLAGTFEHAVMDLAWTPDGLGVYAASYDGTIACIRMDSTLIGEPVSPSEQEALLRKLEESQRSRVLTLPTSLNQVALLDRLNAPIPETNLDHVNNLPPIVSETRLKNGKRRITPQLLQPSNVPPSASTESYTMIIGKPARKAWLKAIPPKRPLNLPSFEITNITGSGCKVIRIHEQKVLWEERFETTFTAAAVSNEGTLFLALSSCRLMILSGAGRRLFPPILLSSMVTQLAITEDLCAALLDNGLFYTWRISADFHCILQDELAPQGIGSELIHLGLNQHHQGDNSTTSFTLSFCFADNTRLLYSSAKKVFFDCEGTTLIDTILDAIYHPNPPIDPASLTKLLSTQLSSSELRSRTTSHIEAQIAAARISNDSDRLVAWLAAYAQRLALEENVYKAQELASELPSLGMRMGLDQEKVQQMIASFLTTSSSVMIRCIADQLSTTSNVGGVNK